MEIKNSACVDVAFCIVVGYGGGRSVLLGSRQGPKEDEPRYRLYVMSVHICVLIVNEMLRIS